MIVAVESQKANWRGTDKGEKKRNIRKERKGILIKKKLQKALPRGVVIGWIFRVTGRLRGKLLSENNDNQIMKTVSRMFVFIGAALSGASRLRAGVPSCRFIRPVFAVSALCCACMLASCVKEDTGDCPVPHHFDYDWCNRIEAESCLGQNHLRLYDGSGICDPHDCPQEGTTLYLKQRHYRVLTYNDRLQGVAYSGLEDVETARATVEEVPTPEIIGRVEELMDKEASSLMRRALRSKAPGEALIGQAEGFLYRDSIPEITVDFYHEGRSLLVPEPVGYEIIFRTKIKGWSMADSKSLELTLSGVVPEVRLVCGSRTEAPVRTALTETTREEERYRSYIYVFGLDRERTVLKGYVDPSNEGGSPVYIERDITEIVSEALDEAEQTGNPRIEFELELVPDQVVQEPGSLCTGTVTIIGWDEVHGGDMGD